MGRPLKPEGTRLRDIAPTGVRLAPELRDALLREATLNGRTLSGEIQHRLRLSLQAVRAITTAHQQQVTRYEVQDAPLRPLPTPPPLGDIQRMLLVVFDAMPPDKQLALLTLLRR
jgi:hypothetical protein